MVSTCCRRRLGQSTLNSTQSPPQMLLWTSSASAFNGLKVAASAVPAHPLHSMASRLPHLLRLRLRLRPRDREVELTARAREQRVRHCGEPSESKRGGARLATGEPRSGA